jgi:glutamate/tyrosine decarboxylase-like PLP-dependent enzyme
LELTRRSRALKLWLMFKVYGAERLATAIERCMVLAEHAQQLLEGDPQWKVVTPAQLGIVTFTRKGWPLDHPMPQAPHLRGVDAERVGVGVPRHRAVMIRLRHGRPPGYRLRSGAGPVSRR